MSKKAFKSQASSSRAASGAFGGDGTVFGSGTGASAFGAVPSSPLSYVYEPPDLSGFSDPNVGVAFKNLQKKDGTTKAKALEDLQTYVSSLEAETGGVEEVILMAWAKIYPRSSIDSSRRVRQLSHTLQGQLTTSCGKRMARHMPKVAASWVAGQYDNDKTVSRAANESFNRVFSSEEKVKNVWRLYQVSILEYARDVVAKETTNTLSDERTTSSDDSSAKYSRVVGASITMVTSLMESNSEAEMEKSRTLLNEFLKEEKLWKLASDNDAFVRRALYRLLGMVLTRKKETLNPSTISASVIVSGLNTTQSGSAFDYAKALALLSVDLPDVWTTYYPGSGKKSAANRLCNFLKKGSQGGPPDFWSQIAVLISNLPLSILVRSADIESDKSVDGNKDSPTPVLSAMHEGLNGKDESRLNSFAAWNAYLVASDLALSSIPNTATRRRIVTSSVLPILAQYVRPSSDNSRWAVAGAQGQEVCVRACNQAILRDVYSFEEQWNTLSNTIIEDLKTSLPEQAKDYVKSQDSLSAEANRWYCLQAALLKGSGQDIADINIQHTIPLEIKSAVSILQARSGKPYAAAAALEILIQKLPKVVFSDDGCKAEILRFVNEALPSLLLSPSAKYLIRLLNHLDGSCDTTRSYNKCMQMLAEAPASASKSIALQSFISSPRLATTEFLSAMVIASLSQAMMDDNSMSWNLVMAAISNPGAPKSLTDEVLANMTEGLFFNPKGVTGLHGLEMTIKHNSGKVTEFARSPKGSGLLSNLLLLADSPDDGIAQRARYTSSAIEQALAAQGGAGQATNSMIEIVNRGFDTAETNSLSIDAVVGQARKVLGHSSPDDMLGVVQKLLPDLKQCNAAVQPFMSRLPDPSLAITNTLGGSLSMIPSTSSTPVKQEVSRDGDGYSAALRMARYTTHLINSTAVFDSALQEQKTIVCKFMALFLQLANDNLSVSGSMPLWESTDPEIESEIIEFVAEAQRLFVGWLHDSDLSTLESIAEVQRQLLDDACGLTATSYYSGRAYSAMTAEIAELRGSSAHTNDADLIKGFRRSDDVYVAAAYLTSASESEELFRLCNYLLTDLTGYDFRRDLAEGMRKLCLTNCIFSRAQDYVNDIPQQRLVFFVQHLVEQLEANIPSFTVAGGQIIVILSFILPAVKEIYGPFWSSILDQIQQIGAQADLYALHASLRLLNLLRRSYMLESNDDLFDAWTEKRPAVASWLVDLLRQLAGYPDDSHQPRRIVNELLKRQLVHLAPDVKAEVQDLYPVIASESAALQEAAYELLHSEIPANQEQVSIDKALSNEFVAQLPEEVMSLILAPPSKASMAGHNFKRNIPPSLRSYVLSWELTFDHWEKASYKVQADYVAALKEGTYTQELLDFIFDILINGRQKPVDASRYDLQTFTLGGDQTPEQETHEALIHLYYLCLRRLPSITKDWWRDSASRQLNIAVESWTQKFISPLVIAQELSVISDWAPSQSIADQSMTVKVSHSAREITASIPIDEQTMTIAVRLPPAYPLARAEVESVHRVGVAEKKWRFWIINAQGVINFSSGGAGEGNSIIDGLMAWRKNVTAAMKGQTELLDVQEYVS
ncbi:MAG: hypothetical protein ASARMPRED_003848 [Alectoria sarmentosa]|nr:MAG: hypothetical protein ASARMPRED_003848 [Alectoria sarmentosa]